ncbi:serine/threonine protein kinase [Blastopirellula sp. JC732]|uniref:Serine/threonine protein kinase n=1 Tax=Blastopirellula sediminis TaxID=2894196 RepID=A0A9X1SGM5_9BACT|nr:serine/threonine-protein kinase [Blastopirellula sediminis]MCC9607565.1 serine/threonine protein kinase [Blastopirellula sediminis]MCC9629142.1 serine/threonine protein kinase [Blastopirellula sediminis]
MVTLSRLGPFALENRLDRRHDTEIFRAVHLKQHRQAAIQILPARYAADPVGRKQLQARSELLRKLNHPNIVRCYGAGIDESTAFLAMELVEGESFAQYMDDRMTIMWGVLLDIAQQVCAGMEFAHSRGVFHLRLNPCCVLLAGEGLKHPDLPLEVKLTNFWAGVAWRKEPVSEPSLENQQYLAPEQFDLEANVDARTDVFSLGCIMYRALSGCVPFPIAEGETNATVERFAIEPPRIATLALDCPIWLDRIIMQMIEVDPAKRPASMEAVASALRETRSAVAAGTSSLEHAVVGNAGRNSNIATGVAKEDARRLLKQKVVKGPAGPIYERPWFLVLCLLLVIGMIGFAFLPMSEQQLFDRGAKLMQSDKETDWKLAEETYLSPLLEKYPDSPHAAEAQALVDKIWISDAESRLRTKERLGKQYSSTGEEMLAAARKCDSLGSQLLAWTKYDEMVAKLHPDSREERPYYLIAQQELETLKNRKVVKPSEEISSVDEYLVLADKALEKGDRDHARLIYRRIVSLYDENPQMYDEVQAARQGLMTADSK